MLSWTATASEPSQQIGPSPSPHLDSVELTPQPAFTDSDLVALVSPVQGRQPHQRISYKWIVDGVQIADATAPSLRSANFVKHQRVTVIATPYVDDLQGDAVTAELDVLNSPPRITEFGGQPVLSGSLQFQVSEGELLTLALVAEDADLDTLSFSADGLPVGAELSGNVLTWTPSFEQAGAYDSVVVTVSDGEDDHSITALIDVANVNRAPVLDSVTIDPAEIYTDTILTALVDAQDPDGDPLTVVHRWQVNGEPVDGAEGPTLDGIHFSKGDAVTAFAFVSDGDIDTEVVASTPLPVLNSVPEITAVGGLPPEGPLVFSIGESEPLAIAIEANDADQDVLSYLATNLPPGATLTDGLLEWVPDYAQAGAYPGIDVTVSDGEAQVIATLEIQVVDSNRPPTILSLALEPEDAYVDTTFSARVETEDPDGDKVAVTGAWYVNGVLVPDHTDPTLTPGVFVKGDLVQVGVTATDGEATTSELLSNEVTVLNTAPVIESVDGRSPLDLLDFAVDEGELLTFEVVASDLDQDALVFSGVDLPAGAYFDGSTFVWTPDFEQSGSWSDIRLQVSDGEANAEATIVIDVTHVNRPPQILSFGGQPYTTGEFSFTADEGGSLELYVDAIDPDGDALEFSGQNLPPGAAFVDQTLSWTPTFEQSGTYAGLTLRVSDQFEHVDATVELIVAEINRAPEIQSVDLGPDGARTDTDLLLTVAASDPDGDPVTLTYVWLRNGTVIDGQVTDTLASDQFLKDDVVVAQVVASDGEDVSAAIDSNSLTIANTPPEIVSIGGFAPGALSFEVNEGQPLSLAIEVQDLDGDAVVLGGSNLPPGASIVDGALVWAPDFEQSGVYPSISVSADDGDDAVSATFEIVVNHVNRPPQVDGLSVTPDEVYTDTPLVAVAALSDPDGDTTFPGFRWQVNGITVNGQTGDTLDASYFARGDQVVGAVQVSDGELQSERVEAPAVTVLNSLPEFESVGGLPVGPTPLVFNLVEDETIALDVVVVDADEDAFTLTATGLPVGAELSGATLTWTPTFEQAGVYSGIQLQADDGFEVAQATIELVVANGNRPPTVLSADITPEDPATDSVLTASATGSDPDGEPISFVYTWSIDGVTVEGVEGDTLDGAFFAKHQQVSVEVVASDGELTSEPFSAAPVTVVNSEPVLETIGGQPAGALTPFDVDEGASLDLILVATDADGDTLSFETSPLPSGAELVDDRIVWTPDFEQSGSYSFQVRVSDDEVTVEPIAVDVVVAHVNRAPTVDLVDVNPDTARTDTELTAVAEGTDPDGDTLTVLWQWQVDGIAVEGATGRTFDGTFFDKHQVVTVEVTGFDGELYSDPVVSTPITVDNSRPALVSIGGVPVGELLTFDADEGTQLALDLVGQDLDGDPLVFEGLSLPAGAEVVGEQLVWTPDFEQSGAYAFDVRALDDDGANSDRITVDVVVAHVNRAPDVSSVTLTPEAPDTDTIISASAEASDPDGDAITRLAWQWTVNGELLDGVISSQLAPSFFQKGDVVVATASATDGELQSDPLDSAPLTIVNAPPRVVSIGGQPVWPRPTFAVDEGGAMTLVLVGSDPDGDAVSFLTVDTPAGVTIVGDTLTWAPDFEAAGDYRLSVQATDGETPGEVVELNVAVANINRAPIIDSVTLPTEPVYTDTELSVTVDAFDPDLDTVELAYVWSVNETPVPDQEGSTLSGEFFFKGDVVKVLVWARDAEDTTGPITSEPVTVLNSLPVMSAIGGEPVGPTNEFMVDEGELISLQLVATDADDDPLSFQMFPLPSGATLSGDLFEWTPNFEQSGPYDGLSLRPYDGEEFGPASLVSITVAHVNRAPSVRNVFLNPGAAYTDTEINAVTNLNDPDSEDVPWALYEWLVNGEIVAGETGETLAGSFFHKHDDVTVRIRAFDGDLESEPVDSAPITILNSEPEITRLGGVLATEPGGVLAFTVDEGTELSLLAEVTDADGDPLTFTVTPMPEGSEIVDGAFVWSPDHAAAGLWQSSFRVEDDDGERDTQLFETTVFDVNVPPELLTIGAREVGQQAAIVFEVSASDFDGDALSYSVSGLPYGASFDAETRTFLWDPVDAEPDTYWMEFIVSDIREDSGSDSEMVGITVEPVQFLNTDNGLTLGLADDGGLEVLRQSDNLLTPQTEGGLYYVEHNLAVEENLLYNSSFETDVDADGVPDGWTPESQVGAEVLCDAARSLDGSLSLRVHTSSSDDVLLLASDPIPVEGSQNYLLDFDIVSDWGYLGYLTHWNDWYQIWVSLRFLDATGEILSESDLVRVSHSVYNWKHYRRDVDAPKAAVDAQVLIRVEGVAPNSFSTTVWFDGMSLAPLPATAGKRYVRGSVVDAGEGVLLQSWEDEDAALQFDVSYVAESGYILVDGLVTSTDPSALDRSFTVGFDIPLDATGWQWWDDILTSRPIAGGGLFTNDVVVDKTGTLHASAYPFASITRDDEVGLAVAVPIDEPRIAWSYYHGAERRLALDFELGVTPLTEKFPNQAWFQLLIFPVERPDWGLRSTVSQYYEYFLDSFAETIVEGEPLRVVGEHLRDLTPVDNPQDFGITHGVGDFQAAGPLSVLPYMTSNDIRAIHYVRPWDFSLSEWQISDAPPTYEEVQATWQNFVDSHDTPVARRAGAALSAPVLDSNRVDYQIENIWEALNHEPDFWTARIPINLDPDLDGESNAAQSTWNDDMVAAYQSVEAEGHLSGYFFDGFFAANFYTDNNTDAFRSVDIPLTYNSDTLMPASHVFFHNIEFLRWLRGELATIDTEAIIIANVNHQSITFWGAPFVDVYSWEADPLVRHVDTIDSQRAYRRTLAFKRPMLEEFSTDTKNLPAYTDFQEFWDADLRRFFNGVIAIGARPSVLEPLERLGIDIEEARPFYQQYSPVAAAIQEAGWEPVTHAWSSASELLVERFGDVGGPYYFTIYNPSPTEFAEGTVTVDLSALGMGNNLLVSEELEGETVNFVNEDGLLVIDTELDGGDLRVYRLLPVSE